MEILKFYGIKVPYDGRPLGLICVDCVNKSAALLSTGHITATELQKVSSYVKKKEFVEIVTELREYSSELLKENDDTLTTLSGKNSVEIRTEIQNTNEFLNSVLKALRGK